MALLDGQQVALECLWHGHEGGRQAWVRDLNAWVRDGKLRLEAIDVLAVGLGPGAFSGLRMAIALVRGLAMPAGTPVHGVSSGAALAWRTHRETGASQVVTVGDARRNELWLGRFRCGGTCPVQEGSWEVAPHDRIPAEWLAEGAVWVTPDWHRIGDRLKAVCPNGVRLIQARSIPQARDVAALAEVEVAAGRASMPLVPIYLNPAVSVEPRFAAGT
jgi:tRNA threonylcarbamoyladenosine biosynthesis protein TsaB